MPEPTIIDDSVPTPRGFRTDRNNNPAAFTVDIAKQAGLKEGVEYVPGDPFPTGNLVTAKLLGDPVALTIKVIDKVGYYTKWGQPRWTYVALPQFVWSILDYETKKKMVAFHYAHEGGEKLKPLFA